MAAGGVGRERQTRHIGDPVQQRPSERPAEGAAAQAHRLQLPQRLPPPVQAGVGGLPAHRVDPAEHSRTDAVDEFGPRRHCLREQQQRHEAADGEQQRERIVLGAQQECATEAQQGQSHHLERAGHHQLPGGHHRGGTPESLLAVDEGRREYRSARHRRAQCVAGVERRFRPPLLHRDSRGTEQRPLNLGEAVHREQGRGDRGEYPPEIRRQQAVPRLGQLIPDQNGLDGEHHGNHPEDGPAHPPVPRPGRRAALLTGRAGRRVVGHVLQRNFTAL